MTGTSSAPHSPVARRRERAGRFWMRFPFVLLGTMLAGWGYMVSVALDDPSFSVEKDYYAKAVQWDAHQAQQATNRALGWKLVTRFERRGAEMCLIATLVDRKGVRLRGARITVNAFQVARGVDVVEASLVERYDGSYEAVLPVHRVGIWELRYSVERGGETFTSVQREELVRGGAS